MPDVNFVDAIDTAFEDNHDFARDVFRFFLFFGRFEYALKREHEHSRRSAKVKWKSYVLCSLDGRWSEEQIQELMAEFTELNNPPPYNLGFDAEENRARWREFEERDTDNELLALMDKVFVVRNNLVHGEKPIDSIIDRDHQLVKEAMKVLEFCLSVSPDEIKRHFRVETE